VEASQEDLTQHFESLSDEELLQRLRSETLTPLAIKVAGGILRSRGVDSQSLSGAAESAVGPDDEGVDLVTVAVEWDPLKATLLRALLESHGVFAHVWGEHLATANIFLSNAGGGSRVQVRSDQVSQARELISAFERGELEAPDLLDEEATTEQTTSSQPYTFPANPYIPSPAAIDASATDQALEQIRPEPPPARPLVHKKARAPSSPLGKVVLLVVGSVVVLALWLMFTH